MTLGVHGITFVEVGAESSQDSAEKLTSYVGETKLLSRSVIHLAAAPTYIGSSGQTAIWFNSPSGRPPTSKWNPIVLIYWIGKEKVHLPEYSSGCSPVYLSADRPAEKWISATFCNIVGHGNLPWSVTGQGLALKLWPQLRCQQLWQRRHLY